MTRNQLAGLFGVFFLLCVGWSASGYPSDLYVSDLSAGILYYPTLDTAVPKIRDATSTGFASDVCALSNGGFATLSSMQHSIYVFVTGF